MTSTGLSGRRRDSRRSATTRCRRTCCRPTLRCRTSRTRWRFDDDAGILFIGHLTGNTARAYTGGFSMFDIAPRTKLGPEASDKAGLEAPRFIAPFPSPFLGQRVGLGGHLGLEHPNAEGGHGPGPGRDGRCLCDVSLRSAGCGPGDDDRLSPWTTHRIARSPRFPTAPITARRSPGRRRAVCEFIDERRSFVLQRTPPALIGFLDSTPTDVLETCGSPTFLDQHDSGVGATPVRHLLRRRRDLRVRSRPCRGW